MASAEWYAHAVKQQTPVMESFIVQKIKGFCINTCVPASEWLSCVQTYRNSLTANTMQQVFWLQIITQSTKVFITGRNRASGVVCISYAYHYKSLKWYTEQSMKKNYSNPYDTCNPCPYEVRISTISKPSLRTLELRSQTTKHWRKC